MKLEKNEFIILSAFISGMFFFLQYNSLANSLKAEKIFFKITKSLTNHE